MVTVKTIWKTDGLPAPHWKEKGAIKTSLLIFCKKWLMMRVLYGLSLLGLVGHQDHGLETASFPKPQRRHPDIKPEDPPHSHLCPQPSSAGPEPAESASQGRGKQAAQRERSSGKVCSLLCSYFLDLEYSSQMSWPPECSQEWLELNCLSKWSHLH